jgi:RNA polymerase sigma factor for flagellar operon FliA
LDEFLTRARGAVVVSLEDLGVQDEDGYKTLGLLTDSSQPDPLASLVHGRERQVLCQAIEELAEKERLVLTLYYFEELTMKEIGQILKVTESRVCQIHSKAIVHLKARLHPVEA